MKDKYRAKFVSVVIQPKMEDPGFWLTHPTEDEIITKLNEVEFPTPDLVTDVVKTVSATDVNKGAKKVVKNWAFGTETSEKTKIPHYQIYLEFPVLIRTTSVYENMDLAFKGKAHIVTEKVYSQNYASYCLKTTSNFEFEDSVYYNVKQSSAMLEATLNHIVDIRPKLNMIKENYYSGQELLKTIALGEPDDRTGVWLADVIGGTGKTGFFQTIITDPELNGIYLRVSEGVERLSAKLRKKIKTRLDENKGYPRFIWINFGRTVEEEALKAFSDFSEQILDGMLDDNFGNTAGADFVPLPYVNLMVTANTPPNMLQLTSDRLKILTLFPIHWGEHEQEEMETTGKPLKDSVLIPIYVETRVRIQKRFPSHLEYKFKIRIEKDEFIKENYSRFAWYEELKSNVKKYHEYKETDSYRKNSHKHTLESEWVSANPNTVQQDVHRVYAKALHATALIREHSEYYFEASSFRNTGQNENSETVYYYKPKLNVSKGKASKLEPLSDRKEGQISTDPEFSHKETQYTKDLNERLNKLGG